MLRPLFYGAALALGLTLTGTVSAAPIAHYEHHFTGHHLEAPYYRIHGHPYDHGYYFPGRDHHHWAYRVWDSRWNRYQYWDSNLRVFYYYNPTLNGYYPCP
jgi:hypothetical protein